METILEAEKNARSRLELGLLRDPLSTLQLAFDLVGTTVQRVLPSPMSAPPSRLVAVKLLNRIGNDLRWIRSMASKGYPQQAADVACSVYEATLTVSYIGSDNELAISWNSHDDPTQFFVSPLQLSEAAAVYLDPAEASCGWPYRIYQQLCMAKHFNPLLVRNLSVRIQDDVLVEVNGPDESELATRCSWLALCWSIWLTHFAVRRTAESHLDEDARACIAELAAPVREALARFGNEATKAGWTIDPFPGAWTKKRGR